MEERIVIIGNGCAAMECVIAAREAGAAGGIVMLADNGLPSFNPMLVTYYAAGKIEYGNLFPYGSDFYEKHNVIFNHESPAAALDTKRHIVTTAAGDEIPFDKCLIASGASPVLPAAFADVKDKVLTLRNADDAERFKELLSSGGKRALVVGASMIGIKAAETLVDAGFEVLLVDLAKNIFPLASHENCSEIIHGILERKNVKLLPGSAAEKVTEEGDGFSVSFSGRPEPEQVNHIIVCVGTAPNISFIDKEQIRTGRGVLVDEYMRTSAEGVYAAGDVCEAPGLPDGDPQVLGLISNARLQGRTAGQNIAGKKGKYAGTIPHNITHFFGNDFIGIGDVKNGDDVYEEIDKEAGRYIRLVFTGRNLTGVNLLNVPEIPGILKYHLTKGMVQSGEEVKQLDATLAMNRVYERYPEIEKFFAEKR